LLEVEVVLSAHSKVEGGIFWRCSEKGKLLLQWRFNREEEKTSVCVQRSENNVQGCFPCSSINILQTKIAGK
jgi:hypothetical protein